MFREFASAFDATELSLEKTLALLSERRSRPPEVSDEIWSLISRGDPFSEDELSDLHDALIHG
jgi:hypothetical protein